MTTGLVLTLRAICSDVNGPGCRRPASAIHARMCVAIVSRLLEPMTPPCCNHTCYIIWLSRPHPCCLVRTLQGANSGNMRRRPMRERVRPDRPNAGVPASRDHERPRRHRVPGTESTALHRHPENRRTTPCCGNKWFYRLIATYIADCPVTPTRTSMGTSIAYRSMRYQCANRHVP